MRFVLTLEPSAVQFTPPLTGGPHPLLLDVGSVTISCQVGDTQQLGGRESSSVDVTLDNRGNRAATIVGLPLRKAAQIFNDDGSLFFAGYVSGVAYGKTVTTLTVGA